MRDKLQQIEERVKGLAIRDLSKELQESILSEQKRISQETQAKIENPVRKKVIIG